MESKARVRDETKNATEVVITAGNSMRTASKVDVGTHLSEQEVMTDAFSNNEAKTQEIGRVKICSKKCVFAKTQLKKRWCSAKNPAVPFSKWTM